MSSCFLTACVAVLAIPAHATTLAVPAGLQPGDEYRLIFVTSTTTTNPSSLASYYNSFVTSAATAGGSAFASITASYGLGWFAIGTFTNSNVFDNIGFSADSVGIYGLDGTKVAAGTGTASAQTAGELFGGALISGSGGIHLAETGVNRAGATVWTGTNQFGGGVRIIQAGSPLDNYNVQTGQVGATNSTWINSSRDNNATIAYSMYGISSTITVQDNAPEPTTVVLAGVGILLLTCVKRRSRSM